MASPAPPRDSSVSSTSTVGGRNKQLMNGLRAAKGSKSQPDKDVAARPESSTPDAHSHDRLLFLLANFVGFPVALSTHSGQSYTGIFSGASLDGADSRFVLKMVKKSPDPTAPVSNGAADHEPYIGYGEDHAMDFARDDMVDLHVTGVTFDKNQPRQANGSAAGFRTDTDISGNRLLKERELVAWQPSGDVSADLSLNANGNTSWDQFEVNERLYGVKTDYDEGMYTTQIDRSAPSYKERAAAAERKAREIEGSAGGSFQEREDANDVNEEERFSGVQRDAQPLATSGNKYTLPARRPPTGQPTVSGAPVDPAIISSQLARPKVLAKTQSQTAAADPQMKENIPAAAVADNGANEVSDTKDAPRDLTPNRPVAPVGQSRSPNATETVERDVLKSFKDFSAGEKMRVQEQQRKLQRRDKEVKLNDLKKFAENFRLPRAVPEDMLGILAKDKKKQEQILRKSVTDAEAKKSPPKTPAVPEPAAPQKPAAPAAARAEPPVPAPIPIEPANQRVAGRGRGHVGRDNLANGRSEKGQYGGGAGRGMQQGGFGARKMREFAGQAAFPGAGNPMAPPAAPTFAIQTDVPLSRSAHAHTPSSATSSKFNVAAHEFRPNPTASTFSPSANVSSVTSQTGSRPVSKAHSPTKKSFFDGQRPRPVSEHRSISDGYNPIKRMRSEAETEGKTKDYAQNDGIPPAYSTRPTWETTKENSEKSYNDMFDKSLTGPSMAAGGMPHQHQLPLHLQQGAHGGGHFQGPQHTPRFAQSPMHHGQREHYFEDNRMQFSTSQPGMYGSPRAQSGMMVQHSPMGLQAAPVYNMPPSQMFMPGQQMPVMGYNQRPGSMPPQMMGSPGMPMAGSMPQGQQFMVPGQGGQMMYSPAAGQAYPVSGPQTPGGYPSPRPPPMMAQQGSQQGHVPQMMYQSGSQQGYYMQQQGQPMNQMRGGYPMQQQGSYGASPHMHYQHPMQGPRGPQQYGNFGQHNMQGGHPMHHAPPTAGSDMK